MRPVLGLLVVLAIFSETSAADRDVESIMASEAAANQALTEKIREKDCAPLKPGETRIVADSGTTSLTKVGRRFRVTRDTTNRNKYNIEMRIKFFNMQKAKDPTLSPEELDESQKYAQRVRDCFALHRDRIRSPNGTILNFNIVGGDEVDKDFPGNVIFVGKELDRDDSMNWSSNKDCGTVIHEVLHLAGLVDEYQEHSIKAADGGSSYDCRHRNWKETIMSGHEPLGEQVKYALCSCPEKNFYCKVKRFPARAVRGEVNCPKGWIASGGVVEREALNSLLNMNMAKGNLLVYRTAKDSESPILSNGQTRAIERPNCERDNVYITCSKNAYRTKSVEGCLDVPRECEDGMWD